MLNSAMSWELRSMSDIIMDTVQTIAPACVPRPTRRVAGTLLDMCQPSSLSTVDYTAVEPAMSS